MKVKVLVLYVKIFNHEVMGNIVANTGRGCLCYIFLTNNDIKSRKDRVVKFLKTHNDEWHSEINGSASF